MEEDWDNLIILDACRADAFEEVANIERFDEYRRVISGGERTDEWAAANFRDKEFPDTVYVTGSPQISRVSPGSFHDLIEIWDDAFDENTHAILPSPIVSSARQARSDFPNKRIIVHFMQPHIPFVPDDNLRFRDWWDPHSGPENWEEIKDSGNIKTVWEAARKGVVNENDIWEGYLRNLEFVLDPVLELCDNMDGKTVITSDHGNLFGERVWPFPLRYYGHPRGILHDKLLTVPWAVINSNERINVKADGLESDTQMDDKKIKQRLKTLGYTE